MVWTHFNAVWTVWVPYPCRWEMLNTLLLCWLKYAKAYSFYILHMLPLNFNRTYDSLSLLLWSLFLEECISSLGLTSRKLPDSALSASSEVRWTIIRVTCQTGKIFFDHISKHREKSWKRRVLKRRVKKHFSRTSRCWGISTRLRRCYEEVMIKAAWSSGLRRWCCTRWSWVQGLHPATRSFRFSVVLSSKPRPCQLGLLTMSRLFEIFVSFASVAYL